MTQTLKETSSAVALLSVSLVAEAASKMPDPEQVNNVMSLLTQFIVLGIAIWRAIKKPKPSFDFNTFMQMMENYNNLKNK